MEILKSGYGISHKNYRKPTPKTLKLWADLGLLVSAIGDIVLINMPSFPGDEWVKYAVGVLPPVFKLITTFISAHNPVSD